MDTGPNSFWGKTKDVGGDPPIVVTLSLADHCLDVSAVFRHLVGLPTINARLAAATKARLDDVLLDRLAVLALLHDLGKANLGFQARAGDPLAFRAGHIAELGPLLFEDSLVGRLELLLETVMSWFSCGDDCEAYLLATWSHHGRALTLSKLEERGGNYYRAASQWWRAHADRDPFTAIKYLLDCAENNYPLAFHLSGQKIPSDPGLQHRFAGLVMLADWIASDDMFFPVDRLSPFDRSAAANEAIAQVGLDVDVYRREWAGKALDFKSLFQLAPRPLQEAVDNLPASSEASRLLILEAETGSGKTEAALLRFAQLVAEDEVDSLYFALPTRVAAREIYGRVVKWLQDNFSGTGTCPTALLAVPGYVRVDDVPLPGLLPSRAVCFDDPADQLHERYWAAERPKRFLAAPVAVGTIDQALLSIIQVRHSHLRSVCLDRSLLVVDEVHSSDKYMGLLLEALLRHHIGLGGHAVLLSATLGSEMRSRLVRAAGGQATELRLADACEAPYPAVTDLGGTPARLATGSNSTKTVQFSLEPRLKDPQQMLAAVSEALYGGARVLVVMNTVARAIAFHQAAEEVSSIARDALFQCAGVACPHHGRFAPCDREVLDAQVTQALGKGSGRGTLLLVGTQTLEQSLDIDCDLLITDLCPADVLLQRVGRLHRHSLPRPSGFETPRCIVLSYEEDDRPNILDVAGNPVGWLMSAGLGSVYEDLRVLELTRQFLAENSTISIPEDNRRAVEATTHPESLDMVAEVLSQEQSDGRWRRHVEQVQGTGLAEGIAAHLAITPYDKPFGQAMLTEIRPEAKVQTRLGLGSIRVMLDRTVMSPFGIEISEMQIPEHMAPREENLGAKVIQTERGVTLFEVGDRTYRYSRLGLEVVDEQR